MPVLPDQWRADAVRVVAAALEEDLGGPDGVDVTAQLVPEDKTATARVITR